MYTKEPKETKETKEVERKLVPAEVGNEPYPNQITIEEYLSMTA